MALVGMGADWCLEFDAVAPTSTFNVVKVVNGDESTINNKAYYGFKTVDQMVQMLSDQHTIDNMLTLSLIHI